MAATPDAFTKLQSVLVQDIIAPLVWLLMMVAFVYFLYGVVEYIWKGGSPQARSDGQRHMLWGIIGIGIMLSVFGIMHFIFGTVTSIGGTTGVTGQQIVEPSIDKGFTTGTN